MKMENKSVLYLQRVLRLSPFLILLLFSAVIALLDSSIFTFTNIYMVFVQSSPAMLMSFGMMIVLTSGNMDMSGSYGVLFDLFVFGHVFMGTNSFVMAFLCTAAVGIIVGMVNGIFVGVLELPSFFVTIATMSVLQGCALILSKIGTAVVVSDASKFISNGKIFGVFPVIFFLVLVVAVILQFVMTNTRFGTNVYALGSNKQAAKVNGVNIPRMQIKVFMVSGLLTALAAVLLACRASVITAGMGGPTFLLDAVTATIIGGTSSSGGRGNICGTLVGALLIGFLSYSVTALGVSPTSVDMVKGAVVILALVIETMIEKANMKLEMSKG